MFNIDVHCSIRENVYWMYPHGVIAMIRGVNDRLPGSATSRGFPTHLDDSRRRTMVSNRLFGPPATVICNCDRIFGRRCLAIPPLVGFLSELNGASNGRWPGGPSTRAVQLHQLEFKVTQVLGSERSYRYARHRQLGRP